MSYDGIASRERIEFYVNHMTFEEAAILLHGGWVTEDEHAMFLAAMEICSEYKASIQTKLIGKYYSDPKNDRRKESRRKDG